MALALCWRLIFLCPRDRRSGGILILSCLSFCHFVLLSETLTFLITFEQWVLERWYFIWVFLVIRPFHWYHCFLTCDLDPFFKNFNLANNFWTVSARALIFHMSIPCDKTIVFYPVTMTHFWKTLTLLITFEQWVLEPWYFTWVSLVMRPFRGCHYFWPCDLDLRVWPTFWKL